MDNAFKNPENDYAALLDELSQLNVRKMNEDEIVQVYGNLELALSELKEENQTTEIISTIGALKAFKKEIYDEVKSRGLDINVEIVDGLEVDETNVEEFAEMICGMDIFSLVNTLFTLEKLTKESEKYEFALELVRMEIVNRAIESGASC